MKTHRKHSELKHSRKDQSRRHLEKMREIREAVSVKIEYPLELPISEFVDEIKDALSNNQVLIVAGETGSGKTTQIPKILLEAGYGSTGKIGCTQPRRVAATSIARQVASELQTEVGAAVGFKIRFNDKSSEKTRVQFMTDGILLAETQQDRFLNAYDALIIDEAHERSLNIDFLLGFIKQLLPKRPDLRLIITSASIDTERFSTAFYDAPVIGVSGRSFPVEIQYKPLDEDDEESGDYTILDAVVDHTRDLLDQTWQGDILVFLPGEMEIREVSERLLSYKETVEVLPLYGRLTAKEQNRIFQESPRRKVIIATNIAETSLTIPGIRYVIDSGMARISRYSPKARIQRLPVERIAQSNALQRAGRAGRIEAGVCLRLFSEEIFQSMREYAEPEILRTNLSGVILKMLTMKLGDSKLHGPARIASFPFIDPPAMTAIKEGFRLLRELGAVNDQNKPLKMGFQMARLPIEPQAARMLLEAHHERALREVLVIVAGLSIQDPRDYPMEQKEKARLEHRKFHQPESDYLTLLKIWDTYHEEWEKLGSENKMRKFCKKHFLSFVRMREWRDIHHQLSGILKESGLLFLNQQHADFGAIHRSILSGLLTHIAQKSEGNSYKTTGGKEVWVFPGSGLYKQSKPWILAGEQVETSKLYARKVANIEPEWLEKLGGKLCRRSYSEAYFDENSGIVQAFEKVSLHGLTIVPRRKVPFGKINPAEATEIFIRSALVEENLQSKLGFYRANRKLKKALIENDAKTRRNREYEYEAAQEAFYRERLFNIFSIHDLNRLLKQKWAEDEDQFLFMSEQDFFHNGFQTTTDSDTSFWNDENSDESPAIQRIPFPEFIDVAGQRLKIRYAFAPGEEHDGPTLQITDEVIAELNPQILEWIIPGQWEDRVLSLLKSLPKTERKKFVPIPQTAKILAEHLNPGQQGFGEALSDLIRKEYRINVTTDQWKWEKIPDHLKLRIELKSADGKIMLQGRNIPELLRERQRALNQQPSRPLPVRKNSKIWEKEQAKWYMVQITEWNFDLPQKIKFSSHKTDSVQKSNPANHELEMTGFPGLKMVDHEIQRHLFTNREEALRESKPAFNKMLALKMGPDLAWLEKDTMTELRVLEKDFFPFGSISDLKDASKNNIHDFLFEGSWISNQTEFEKRLEMAKTKIQNVSRDWVKSLKLLLSSYQETTAALNKLSQHRVEKKAQMLWDHLAELMPKKFLHQIAFEQWPHLKRYLKAIRVRVERMEHNPEKDEEKYEQLAVWLEVFQELKRQEPLSKAEETALQEMQVMLEEFRVSLFAPELKTAIPVSAKRLDKFVKKHFADHALSLRA